MFPVIERLVAWCLESGLKRAAQVYPDSAIKQQFIDQMVVEESGDFRRAHFDSADKAMEWLNS